MRWTTTIIFILVNVETLYTWLSLVILIEIEKSPIFDVGIKTSEFNSSSSIVK